MSEPLLRLENASFGYAGRPVVRGATLALAAGDFLGLVGANGAGKSTLLKGLLGLLPPLSGRVARSAALGRAVGWVPQRDALDALFPMTALDVALQGRALVRPWHARLDARDRTLALAALDAVGLAGARDEPFAALSGGQRQRALIARALAVEPRLLVLDEPTAGVDPETERTVIELVARKCREDGLAVVLVTHHHAMLKGRAQRLVTVEDGALAQAAP